jgi:hypothetical protein
LFALVLGSLGILGVGPASGQTAPAGILAPGNAVVTGFSGTTQPAQIAPGGDPGDQTFIDPNGAAVEVFNLQAPGAPPQAQVVPAPVLFTATASQVGQVFGVALDNANPPNIYAAATSAYGLPIVLPGSGGTLTRTHQGAPGAVFMTGLFGPAAQNGGPGSIWRIDGTSGAVTLFANVTSGGGAANSGPALGGLAFDPVSNTLLVADRETGIIHGFDLTGKEIGTYDHGAQGRPAGGLPAVAFDPTGVVPITSPQFSSDKPASWGYPAPERRVFGLVVQGGRLYYAVAANLQIWSVSLGSGGSFGADARMEVQVPPGQGATEISKIAFDDRGNMLLADRPAPTGDYELVALAQSGIGRVLRFVPTPGAPGTWQPAPNQYAIGFPDPMTNANGGVAVGYGYDANGTLDPASCSGFVWSTGEQLRTSADPNTASLLASTGTPYLNGLQGNGIDLVEPANVPPLQTYFVDYGAQFDNLALRGYLGDITIPRSCAPASPPPPPLPTCPSGYSLNPAGICVPPSCPPGQVLNLAGVCVTVPACPPGELLTATGVCVRLVTCPPGELLNVAGVCVPWVCQPGEVLNAAGVCVRAVCPPGEVLNAARVCVQAVCPTGYSLNPAGFCVPVVCRPGEALNPFGICVPRCRRGEVLNADRRCVPVVCRPGEVLNPVGICVPQCRPGEVLNAAGRCVPVCLRGEIRNAAGVCVPGPCPRGEIRNAAGVCVPAPVCPPGQLCEVCPPGQVRNTAGTCVAQPECPRGEVRNAAGICVTPPCPAGETRNADGVCVAPPVCPPGQVRNTAGVCVAEPSCPRGEERNAAGVCVASPCPAGETRNADGVCVAPPVVCPPGRVRSASGVCVAEPSCPPGETRSASGTCVAPQPKVACPRGQVRDPAGTCVNEAPPACPAGETRNAAGTWVRSAPQEVPREPAPREREPPRADPAR